MTEFIRTRNTLMTNRNGVLESCLTFNLPNVIPTNTPIYFYKWDVLDIVEIDFAQNLIMLYDFPFSDDRAMDLISKDVERYASYFKTAGLEGKRFLFDVSLKLPIRYDDFIERPNNIGNIRNSHYIFLMDKKEGYVIGEKQALAFSMFNTTSTFDKAALSLFNQLVNVTNPKDRVVNNRATIMLGFLSGFQSGLTSGEYLEQLDKAELSTKFVYTASNVYFTNDRVENHLKGLKVAKFSNIVESTKPKTREIVPVVEKKDDNDYYSSDSISLFDLLEITLDPFIRKIRNPDKIVKIIIDTEWQSIKSAYIVKGCAFITPIGYKGLDYYRELLNSDNVQLVMS